LNELEIRNKELEEENASLRKLTNSGGSNWDRPEHMVKYVGMKGCISGAMFDLFNPTADMVNMIDIGWGLASQIRFGGQCLFPYSVAQHSVLLSYAVRPEWAAVALMHDASEAYCGDMIMPLKILLPEFEILEHAIQKVIFAKYGLDYDIMQDINRFDKLICPHEAATVQPLQSWWRDVEIPKELRKLDITHWPAATARTMFFKRVDELLKPEIPAYDTYVEFCKRVGVAS
jgi:hypothetical protein